MSTLGWVLLILLVIALAGGGLGHATWGAAGWSPLGILLIIFIVLLLTGRL